MKKDKHHLLPKHRGGTDADGLVEVTKTRHAMFHFCEWQLHNLPEDKLAWRALSGQINAKEISEELEKIRVAKSVAWHTGKKRSPEACKRISEAKKGKTHYQPPLTAEHKANISKTRKERYGKTEEHKKAVRKAHRETPAYKERKNARERERYARNKGN